MPERPGPRSGAGSKGSHPGIPGEQPAHGGVDLHLARLRKLADQVVDRALVELGVVVAVPQRDRAPHRARAVSQHHDAVADPDRRAAARIELGVVLLAGGSHAALLRDPPHRRRGLLGHVGDGDHHHLACPGARLQAERDLRGGDPVSRIAVGEQRPQRRQAKGGGEAERAPSEGPERADAGEAPLGLGKLVRVGAARVCECQEWSIDREEADRLRTGIDRALRLGGAASREHRRQPARRPRARAGRGRAFPPRYRPRGDHPPPHDCRLSGPFRPPGRQGQSSCNVRIANAWDHASGVVETAHAGARRRPAPAGRRPGWPPGAGREQAQRAPPVAHGGEGPGGPGRRRSPGIGPVPVLRGEDPEAAVGGEQRSQRGLGRPVERRAGEGPDRPGCGGIGAGGRLARLAGEGTAGAELPPDRRRGDPGGDRVGEQVAALAVALAVVAAAAPGGTRTVRRREPCCARGQPHPAGGVPLRAAAVDRAAVPVEAGPGGEVEREQEARGPPGEAAVAGAPQRQRRCRRVAGPDEGPAVAGARPPPRHCAGR